jgi:HAD superfamily hydrolase (TIGR01509 family)
MSGKTIQAVVFDFDGLLVDSEPVQYEAWETYIARFGAELPAKLRERMYGTRLVDSAALVSEELRLPVSAIEIARDRDELFLAIIPGRILPKRGARTLIAELKRRQISVALATSGHRRYVDLACVSAGLTGVFDVEVTGDMVSRGKPHPETYLTAARMLQVPASACLVLEDSPQGVAAARAAGMTVFAVPDATVPGADLSAACVVLESLDDVLDAAVDYGLTLSSSSQG